MRQGAEPTPGAIVTVTDEDLAALSRGASTFASLYQHGRLRIDGDVATARRLEALIKQG